MNIDVNNLTDDEKSKLKELKQQFDDGLISKRQYEKARKTHEIEIKRRIKGAKWRNTSFMGKFARWAALAIGLTALLFGIEYLVIQSTSKTQLSICG